MAGHYSLAWLLPLHLLLSPPTPQNCSRHLATQILRRYPSCAHAQTGARTKGYAALHVAVYCCSAGKARTPMQKLRQVWAQALPWQRRNLVLAGVLMAWGVALAVRSYRSGPLPWVLFCAAGWGVGSGGWVCGEGEARGKGGAVRGTG